MLRGGEYVFEPESVKEATTAELKQLRDRINAELISRTRTSELKHSRERIYTELTRRDRETRPTKAGNPPPPPPSPLEGWRRIVGDYEDPGPGESAATRIN